MAIKIQFLANIVDALRGTKDLESAFEDVSSSLDDVAADAQRAGQKTGEGISDGAKEAESGLDRLERSFRDLEGSAKKSARTAGRNTGDEIKDGARDAENSVERVEGSFKDLADQARKSTSDAGDSMRHDMENGASGASEAVAEFGDEAKQNVAETFSSFRGEAEDFAQIAQDTFGGVISNLGPVGMAAGAAGALGIGLLMAEFERAKEREQEFRDSVGELAGELIEIGGDPAEAVTKIADRLRDLATQSEEGKESLADLHAASKYTSTGYRDLADAATGYGKNLDKVVEAEQERLEAAREAYNSDKRWDSEKTERLKEQRDGLQTAVDALEGLKEQTDQAAEAEAAWLASNGPYYEARAEALGTIQDELDNTVGSWGEYVNAETNAIDPARYIEGMATRREAIANYADNVAQLATEFGLSFEEQQQILDQGLDFAPHLQTIMESGMSGAYVDEVKAAVGGAEEVLGGAELKSTVDVTANSESAQADIESLISPRDTSVTATAHTESATGSLDAAAKNRETTIQAKPDTKTAASALDGVAAKRRVATITAKASTSTASTQLATLASADRTATIKVALDLSTAERQMSEFVNRARTAIVDVKTRTGKDVP